MGTILGILKALLEAIPLLGKLISLLEKPQQQKIEENVEDVRKEIDDFKKTGRPPR